VEEAAVVMDLEHGGVEDKAEMEQAAKAVLLHSTSLMLTTPSSLRHLADQIQSQLEVSQASVVNGVQAYGVSKN
jgi:hypothetical protein